MIEESLFLARFEEIAAHFNYRMTEPVVKVYYKHLSQNLTTDEFMEAAERSLIEFPVRRQLPSPKEIVELIKGSLESKALQEWQMILQAASRNDSESLTYLSNRGHIALGAIGGLNVVAYHEGSLQWIQKDFIQVYCQCSDWDVKVLKQAPAPDPRPKPVADEDLITPDQWQELKSRMKNFGAS